jgi:hypothetical protein
MNLSVRPYDGSDADAWDAFCEDSLQATLLHTRRFLSYHGDRFSDKSLIIEAEGKCLGLFPAALAPDDASLVVSHPGITYGGVLHQGKLRGERMVEVLSEICRHYRSQGYAKLTYKAVPHFYHRAPAQDDLYALFRLAAERRRCDLSCTIDMQHRLPGSNRRRRSLKKATTAGLEITQGRENLPALWAILTENLGVKHGAKPVHSLEEVSLLAARFPEHIRCVCASADGEMVAGLLLFITPTAHHAQYIASSKQGYEITALDLLFEHCITKALAEGRRWFDFGISNEQQGMVLNNGLYSFKSEFGGGGTVHEFYEIDLSIRGSHAT